VSVITSRLPVMCDGLVGYLAQPETRREIKAAMSAIFFMLAFLTAAAVASRLYHNSFRMRLLAALASGVMLAVSFPRLGLFPLAWVALVPILIALRGVTLRQGALLGFITGFTFFGLLVYWVSIFGLLPWFLLCVYQSLFVVLFAMAASRQIGHRILGFVAVPALWTGFEWLRSIGAFGFAWGSLAVSQVKWLGVLQTAGVFSGLGLTFLIVFANMAAVDLIVNHDRRAALVAGIVLLVLVSAGRIFTFNYNAFRDGIRVAVVQGGVPLTWPNSDTPRRIREAYFPMTRDLAGRADIVVWPESAAPGDVLGSPAAKFEIGELARSGGFFLVVGAAHQVFDQSVPGGLREYNGAYMFDKTGRLVGYYNKVRLVPFGEYVPGRRWLPLLDRYPILPYDRYPGRGFYPVAADVTNLGRVGVLICFESTFADAARRLVLSGAQVIVIITNDSWFGNTAAAEQHRDFAVLRAVETRRFVVRAASTGVSCIISPSGRVIREIGLGRRGVIQAEIKGSGDRIHSLDSNKAGLVLLFVGLVLAFDPKISRRKASN